MQNKAKRFLQNYKQAICLTLAVVFIIAIIIAVIPHKYDSYTVDGNFESISGVSLMSTVSGISEVTVFQGEPSSVTAIENNSDSPAYLASGLKQTNTLSDSAVRSYLMSSGVSVSSNTVEVTSSSLDHVIQLLSLNGDGLLTIPGGTGRQISGDTSALEALLSKSGMSVGFLAVRMSDGAAVAYHPDTYFQSCSTVKAPYCLYIAKLIEEGKLDPNKSIAYTSSDYMSGSGAIKNYNYGTHFKVKTLVEYSISKSDNIAHNMLTSAIGTDGFYDMLDRMNCNITSEKLVWPDSNARSAVLWWSQIYSFRNQGSTGKWLWNLLNINYSKISSALGDSKTCYSKTGSSTYCSHESGIVMGNEPYIVAIYTKTTSPYGVSDSYFNSIVREIDKLIAG